MIQPGDEPISGYRVERLLGRGQYGEVWQATSPGRSSVALKFLDMTGRGGWKEFRAVQRVKQIRHAHLMPIVALWLLDEDGQILTDDAVEDLADTATDDAKTLSADALAAKPATRMVIATLLGDCSLRDRLNDCLEEELPGIPRDELIDYMQEAAKGIDYLNSGRHAAGGDKVGVQHCDIKPDNILLSGGSVMIADFGVAQLLASEDGDTRATSLSGSPAYMAPESFEARPSASSDQYALAVTYYELRTGRLPVDPMNFAAAYDAHRTGALDFSAVPPVEAEVLRRATEPDAEERFDSTADFIAALRDTTVDRSPLVQESRTPWLAFGALAVAALAAALLIVIGVLLNRPTVEPQPPTVERASIVLQFDAPGANVVVAGAPLKAGPDGRLEVEALVDSPLTVAADNNQGRHAMQTTIPAAEIVAGATFKFSLPRTAEHYAAEAERLLEAGDNQQAIEELTEAIKQSADRFARLPAPETRETAEAMWEDCLQVTPRGEAVIAGGRDGIVRRWTINADGLAAEPEELHRHEGGQIVSVAVAQGAAGPIFASACNQGAIWLRKEEQSQPLAEAATTLGEETKLAFTGDGKWLVAARAESLMTQLDSWNLEAPDPQSTRTKIGEQPGEFPRIISTVDDSVVVATKDAAGLVWRWRVAAPKHQERGRLVGFVWTLSASAAGSLIAYAGDASLQATADGAADEPAIVDVETGERFPLTTIQNDTIPASALSAAGTLLATAERGGVGLGDTDSVQLWRPDRDDRVAANVRILEYDRDRGDVTTLAFSPETEWLAAGHTSGAVSLWWLVDEQPEPVMNFGQGDHVAAVRITPDGRWLVSLTRDGQMTTLDLRRLGVVCAACERAGVTPRVGNDSVTLRDQPFRRAARSLAAGAETGSPPLRRPTAGPA